MAKKSNTKVIANNTTKSSDDKWITIIKEVRKQFAEKIGHYDQGGTVKVTINGDTQICRTDCSGFVSACMYYYGAIKANQHPSSIWRYKEGHAALFSMEDTVFKYYAWPGSWDKVHVGDIMANDEHTQIYAGMKNGKPTAWSYGSDRTAGNPEPETIYSSNYNFFTIYGEKKTSSTTTKSNTTVTEKTEEKPTTTVKPTEEIKKLYRVGTDYKDGKVLNQVGAFISLDNAKSDCTKASKEANKTYNVYDSNFKVVFTASNKKQLYRVGTDYKDGKVLNQVGAFSILDNAIGSCEGSKNTKKTSYYVYDSDFKVVYSAEYLSKASEYFRVGTKWKNDKCENQKGAFKDGKNAKNTADKYTKDTGVTHYVFTPNGKIYYTGKR